MRKLGSWRWGALGALALVSALLAGCSTPGGVVRDPDSGAAPGVEVSAVSTEGLEAARVEAGIADCRSSSAPPVAPSAAQGVAGGLPEVTLPCLGEASTVTMSQLRGPLIINVWAQWCGPCREEAPILAEVSAQAEKKVAFLGIIYNDPRPDYALEFAKLAGWSYPHVLDPEKSLQAPLKIPGPPMTLFVDADGRIAYRHIGPFASADQLRQLTNVHLGVKL